MTMTFRSHDDDINAINAKNAFLAQTKGRRDRERERKRKGKEKGKLEVRILAEMEKNRKRPSRE